MGLKKEMLKVMLEIERKVGWVEKWKEMIEDKKKKIGSKRKI